MKVSLDDYSIETIRYAAYCASGRSFAWIAPCKKNAVKVWLKLKNNTSGKQSVSAIKEFKEELKTEKIRSQIADHNQALREHIIMSVFRNKPPESKPGFRLTARQQAELDGLIAEIEREMKKTSGKHQDPMGITQTWEERYGQPRTA